jgi:hypothetical protein
MTKLMEQAIERLRALPPEKQDSFAGFVLYELESEERWDKLLTECAPALERLADEAWAEHEAGLSEPLDPDEL